MNTEELNTLAKRLQADPLRQKILICRTHTQGQILVERMVKQRGPLLNVSVSTVLSLAQEFAQLRLHELGLKYFSQESQIWFTHYTLQNIVQAGHPVLDNTMLTPGLVRAFSTAVLELRHAGVSSEALRSTSFARTAKGSLVLQLLTAHEEYLENRGLVDDALVYRHAISELTSSAVKNDTQFILSAQLQLDVVAKEFIEQLSRYSTLEVIAEQDNHFSLSTAKQVNVFHAAGSLAEAREVFRRILGDGTAVDDVEIVVSNHDDEALAIRSIGESLGVPVTLSNGLPGHVTGLGQLAEAFLGWLESNFDVSFIIAALRQGNMRIPDETITTMTFARVLADTNIGWGRSRYLPLLKRGAEQVDEDDAENTVVYTRLYDEFSSLLSQLPVGDDWSVFKTIQALEYVLVHFGRVQGDADAEVLSTIQQLKASTEGLESFSLHMQVIVEYLRQLIGSIRVNRTPRPQPGAIYVTTVASGGQSGRACSYVLGMSEVNWTPSTFQDPILLDDERLQIAPGLMTAEARVKREQEENWRFLNSLSGNVTCSYSAYDVTDGRPEGPAPELLTIYRMVTGKTDIDYSGFLEALGEPVGYIGRVESQSSSQAPIDRADLWSRHLLMPSGLWRNGQEAVLHQHRWLREGHGALQARMDTNWTEFDGIVDTTLGTIRKPYFSPTALETLAKCPRQYFFSQVLKVRPSEQTEFNRSQWLDPLLRGSLLHEIFRTYMETIRSGVTHDESRLMGICNEVIARYQMDIPAPSEHIVELECDEIRRSMKKFYGLESVRNSVVKYLEQEIGSLEEPFQLDLGEGVILPLFGKIDRVDEVAPHVYRVMDYKTGSSRKYSENESFKAGQQLQHALYALAVEQWLRLEGIDPSGRVQESSYFFPTVRSNRDEVVYVQNKSEQVRKLVQQLTSVIDKGVFVPTDNPDTCKWCDFAAVCNGQAAAQGKEKRELATNRDLLTNLEEVQRFA